MTTGRINQGAAAFSDTVRRPPKLRTEEFADTGRFSRRKKKLESRLSARRSVRPTSKRLSDRNATRIR